MVRARTLSSLLFIAVSLLVAAACSAAETGPTITYRKVFKSSYPEFIEIKVNQSGAGTCDIRQLDEAASPQPIELGAPLVQKIFGLAAKLHDFQGVDLEVHKRLASLGEKTFRYENGAENHEVTFNYTLDPAGSELASIFEKISQQETDLSDLARTMRYDRLGVDDVVRRIESHYDAHLLPEPQQFIAPLDRLAGDSKFIDVARERARQLATRMRNADVQATP